VRAAPLSYGVAMAPGDTQTLRIESIVAGGDGIARRADGCVVFVPRTAPGELVDAETTDERRQWSRARVTRIVEASAARSDPPCPYYARCGGCQLQHVDYDEQRSIKGAIVAESLRRIGGIELEAPEVVASPRELAYRNRISLVARPGVSGLLVGYHAVDDPDEVVDVDRCLLAEDSVNRVLASLRDAWGRGSRFAPRGRELRLTIRVNAEGAAGLAVEGASDPGRPERFLELVEGLDTIWVLNRKGDVARTAGPKTLEERWGGHAIPLAGTAFVQVNRDVAERLDAAVRVACGDVSGRRVIDAYCGFGLRTVEMARAGADTVGIERDRHAVEAGRRVAARQGVAARLIAGDVERVLPHEVPADVVILNPPRRGVARAVLDTLARSGARRVVYVSCDPATLARDIKGLSDAYRLDLDELCAFDPFPQTAHVETVAVLVKHS
jgi:23S rRNA (uracil1939-C5)-methyltransferase